MREQNLNVAHSPSCSASGKGTLCGDAGSDPAKLRLYRGPVVLFASLFVMFAVASDRNESRVFGKKAVLEEVIGCMRLCGSWNAGD